LGQIDEEDIMNFDRIALAEQRREELLHDARMLRSAARNRAGRKPSVRSLLSRARHW
jgi:hypothetical protein